MQYLRNNAIVAAVFLAIGALTVFIPLPPGWDALPVVILLTMLASFRGASLLAVPPRYADSFVAMALCFGSSVVLSGCVVLTTMAMVVAVHGCL